MKDKVYFPNLNGLRFIAAFMVIFSHLELNKSYFGIANHFHEIKHIGKLGVTLFFVLSGFLITFLLLVEKEEYSTISYRKFYLRRILRIWPLYYLIVILSLFILPLFDFFHVPGIQLNINNAFEYLKVILLFVFFLPNLLISIKLIPFATQTWSIGTEEQFYLIWPWIINNVSKLIILFLVSIIAYNILLNAIEIEFFKALPYHNLIKNFIHSFQLDALTMGALAAFALYTRHSFLKLFAFTPLFLISISTAIFIIICNIQIPYVNSLFYSFLFGIIILCLVYNKRLRQLFENRVFNYLGKISYGLYMYHQILIIFSINFLAKYNIVYNGLIYIVSITLTIIVAEISYRYLETPFLKKKSALSAFSNPNHRSA